MFIHFTFNQWSSKFRFFLKYTSKYHHEVTHCPENIVHNIQGIK